MFLIMSSVRRAASIIWRLQQQHQEAHGHRRAHEPSGRATSWNCCKYANGSQPCRQLHWGALPDALHSFRQSGASSALLPRSLSSNSDAATDRFRALVAHSREHKPDRERVASIGAAGAVSQTLNASEPLLCPIVRLNAAFVCCLSVCLRALIGD